VHDGLGGPPVEHLDVESDQLEHLGEVVAHSAVRAHARRRRHVVALELAHQGVEHDAREVPLAREALCAGHQRILVGPVQGIAGLECQRALPLVIADERARHARRQHVLAVLRVHGLWEHPHRPAEELAARVLLHLPSARMVEAIRVVDLLYVLRLVPVEDLEVVDRSHHPAIFRADRRRRAPGQGCGLGVRDRECQGDRPGEVATALGDAPLVEHLVIAVGAHRPLQRGQRAVADPIHGGEVGAGHLHLGQIVYLLQKRGALVQRHDAVHRLVEPSVDGYQVSRRLDFAHVLLISFGLDLEGDAGGSALTRQGIRCPRSRTGSDPPFRRSGAGTDGYAERVRW
jgi:hypothetical protein